MRALSLFTTVLLVVSLSYAQDCNNPLLAFFNIPRLEDPQSGEGLPYCSNLQSDQTCCSPDIVASFQDRVNTLIDKLNNYAAAKDLYLAELWSRYLARFNGYLQNITQNYIDDLQAIRQADANLADQLQAHIDTSVRLRDAAQNINDDFQQALYDYQRIRHSCYDTALKIHTAAWCLACDPNYAAQGVAADGSVTFSDGLCQAVSDACLPFFNQGALFNPLVSAREAYWQLRSIEAYLGNFSVTNQLTSFNPSPDPYHPLSTQLVVTVPPEWTGEGQCSNLWSGDVLLAELLTIGAPAEGAIEENVGIQEEESLVDETRSLQLLEGIRTWVADLNLSELNITGWLYDAANYYGLSDFSDLTDDTNITDVTDNNDHEFGINEENLLQL